MDDEQDAPCVISFARFQPRAGLHEPPPVQATAAAEWGPDDRFADFCRRHYLPRRMAHAKRDTLRDVQTSIDYFLRAVGDVRLGELDDGLLADFVSWLAAKRTSKTSGRTLSARTIKKHAVNLAAIVAEMGPRSGTHRTAVRVFTSDDLPMFPHLKIPQSRPAEGFSMSELARIMDGCNVSWRPTAADVAPAQWWRSFLAVLYNAGLRKTTALALRAEWIDADGWCHVPPAAYKRGELRSIYFNRFARAAIRELTGGRSRGLVFPIGTDGERALSNNFQAIQRAAGVEVKPNRKFHAIRRTCATELARLSPSVAAFHLGHAGGLQSRDLAIVRQSYIDGRAVTEWLERLPQPTSRPVQQSLF